jgi:hypothetical protein
MNENTQNKEGLAALEFIVNLNTPPFDWGMIAERVNGNMHWLLEHNDWYDDNKWLEDEFKKLYADRIGSTKVLKAWLLPRLKHEEATRESTYPTLIVLQIIGFLDRSLLVEIINERLTFIGNETINSDDETYYHKKGIMEKTFDPIIATLFRRADGCRTRKEGSNSEKLTGIHDLFLNEPEDEFKTIWQIVSKHALFEYSITNTVSRIIDGSILRRAGFCGSNFITFLENLPSESNSEVEELRTRIVNNNQKVIKEINEQYGYY